MAASGVQERISRKAMIWWREDCKKCDGVELKAMEMAGIYGERAGEYKTIHVPTVAFLVGMRREHQHVLI